MASPGTTASELSVVLEQLQALQKQVAGIAERVGKGEVAMAPGATGPPSNRRPLTRALSLEAPSSEDDAESVIRPAYPHKPTGRLDGLEELNFAELDTLDALKQDDFEGFYNLAALILVFSMAYLVVRNFREKGVLITLDDFTCAPLWRDVTWAGAMIVASLCCVLPIVPLMRLWIWERVGWSAVITVYAIMQTVLLTGPVTVLYLTPIAPLPSAAILLCTCILGLKMHSYVATCHAIHVEHVRRHGRSFLSSAEGQGKGVMATPAAQPPPSAKTTPAKRRAAAGTPPVLAVADMAKWTGTELGTASARRRQVGASTHAAVGGQELAPGEMEEVDIVEPQEGVAPPLPTPSLRAPSMEAGLVGGGAVDLLDQTSQAAAGRTRSFIEGPGPLGQTRTGAIRRWPGNVTLKDFAFYLAAPTLVYEPRYPRTRRIRWWYVATKLTQAAACGVFQYVIMRQFMLPVLMKQAPSPSATGDHGTAASSSLSDAANMAFDMMKLAVPSLAVWISGFYALFHCWLNALAEVLRYADRHFYGAWWNAVSIDAFWRRWNIPVHEWCLRHLYLDLQTIGVNKQLATFATFFFSAIFHELIFSVSFKVFRPWFFIGMLLQMPLMALGGCSGNRRRANYVVWWSLFSGQPLLELLYFREYFRNHSSFFCAADTQPILV